MLGESAHAVDEAVVFVGVVVVTCGQLGRHSVEAVVHLLNVSKHFTGLFDKCRRVGKHHLLRQIAYCHTLRYGHSAFGGLLQSGYYFKHGALAGTVFADKGYFVIGIYYVVYVIEEFLSAELYRQIVDRYHCEESKVF